MGAGWLDAQESRAMTTKPRALDLFCGAGGVSRGLQLAGIDLDEYDFVWASPPSWSCSCDAAKSEDYDALIEAA